MFNQNLISGEMSEYVDVVIDSGDSNFLSDLSLDVNIGQRRIKTLRVFKSNADLQIAQDFRRKAQENAASLLEEFKTLKR